MNKNDLNLINVIDSEFNNYLHRSIDEDDLKVDLSGLKLLIENAVFDVHKTDVHSKTDGMFDVHKTDGMFVHRKTDGIMSYDEVKLVKIEIDNLNLSIQSIKQRIALVFNVLDSYTHLTIYQTIISLFKQFLETQQLLDSLTTKLNNHNLYCLALGYYQDVKLKGELIGDELVVESKKQSSSNLPINQFSQKIVNILIKKNITLPPPSIDNLTWLFDCISLLDSNDSLLIPPRTDASRIGTRIDASRIDTSPIGISPIGTSLDTSLDTSRIGTSLSRIDTASTPNITIAPSTSTTSTDTSTTIVPSASTTIASNASTTITPNASTTITNTSATIAPNASTAIFSNVTPTSTTISNVANTSIDSDLDLPTALNDLRFSHQYLLKQYDFNRTSSQKLINEYRKKINDLENKSKSLYDVINSKDDQILNLQKELNFLKIDNIGQNSNANYKYETMNTLFEDSFSKSKSSNGILKKEFKKIVSDIQDQYESELQKERHENKKLKEELDALRS